MPSPFRNMRNIRNVSHPRFLTFHYASLQKTHQTPCIQPLSLFWIWPTSTSLLNLTCRGQLKFLKCPPYLHSCPHQPSSSPIALCNHVTSLVMEVTSSSRAWHTDSSYMTLAYILVSTLPFPLSHSFVPFHTSLHMPLWPYPEETPAGFLSWNVLPFFCTSARAKSLSLYCLLLCLMFQESAQPLFPWGSLPKQLSTPSLTLPCNTVSECILTLGTLLM